MSSEILNFLEILKKMHNMLLIMKIISSSPGRICLFGEHQDYLGLDVIAMAINLRFNIEAIPRDDNLFYLKMPDINKEMKFIPSERLVYESKRDYLKAVVNILKREYNFDFKQGYNFTFKSKIPVNAGASSSSVMLVAWTSLLLKLHNHSDYKNIDKVCYIAYKAEVKEFNEAGGMMDHYTSGLGGIVHIETKYDPVKYEGFDLDLDGFVLCDSLQPKDTVGVLKNLKKDVLEGVAQLKKLIPDFSFERYTLEDVKNELKQIPQNLQKKLKANLINYSLTQEALKMFKSSKVNDKILGDLLNEHHLQLRDGLGISTDKIEFLLNKAKSIGALGGKINGSGGGGTFFVYAPGLERKIVEIFSENNSIPYIVKKDKGISIFEFEK